MRTGVTATARKLVRHRARGRAFEKTLAQDTAGVARAVAKSAIRRRAALRCASPRRSWCALRRRARARARAALLPRICAARQTDELDRRSAVGSLHERRRHFEDLVDRAPARVAGPVAARATDAAAGSRPHLRPARRAAARPIPARSARAVRCSPRIPCAPDAERGRGAATSRPCSAGTPMSSSRIGVLDRLVGVQRREHEVAGHGGAQADLGGLRSRISPTRITSGSWRKGRAQDALEAEVDLLVHLHLVDAGQAVLDRVLDRDDLAARDG